MVLGLKSKHKKGASVRVDYLVHVEEIRPWPPSESLRSVQTVLLQWQNGDQNTGSFLSVAGESSIVFNESFLLSVTLYRDKKVRDKFHKNHLEFSLFEPRKDKAKGQLLGTASLNLADYGLIESTAGVDAPLSFKKSSNNSGQSALTISLEPIQKDDSSKEESVYNDDDDSEVASFTDDDASSQSSRTAGSLTFESATASPSQSDKNGFGNHVNDYVSAPKFQERSMTTLKKTSASPSITSSPSSISFRSNWKPTNAVENKTYERFASVILSSENYMRNGVDSTPPNSLFSHLYQENDAPLNNTHVDLATEDTLLGKLSEDFSRRQVAMRSDTLASNRKTPAIPPSSSNKTQLKHVKSVQIHGSAKANGFPADIYGGGKPAVPDIPNGTQKKGKLNAVEAKVEISDGTNEWKSRVEMLEDELRETAAIEVGLYSIVAEHASSGNKVHAPARRLSRLYTKACKTGSQAKRARAARAAVSGLVLVSKACGNDATRLTFWLSNSIMLRSIVSQIAAELPDYNAPAIKSYGGGNETHKRLDSSHDGDQSKSTQESDDWEDVLTFIIALERVESWLFSRIVESVWWQTFTPCMQPMVAKGKDRTTGSSTRKTGWRSNNSANREQLNFSTNLWKKAFKDACERLCPIRAAGHECGCLSELVKLVMEQLVNRLDVAMFNAILRESPEEMPTDPISDPIGDSKVLPIPAGKSSFGAAVQLKNVIGQWSRWLSDLIGLEVDSTEDSEILEGGKRPRYFKAFRLLHGLSDLMMLPVGMLADASTRKEVCPMFGPAIIRRALLNFVPDEFSPEPIPANIIDALDSEEISNASGDLLTLYPCTASPTKYSTPPAALLTCEGEVGHQVLHCSRLSTIQKSYNSDDELDELDSPLTSIIPDSYLTSSALAKLSRMPKEKGGRNIMRYQLLREIWTDDE